MQVAAPTLGIRLQALSVREVGELKGAFAAMRREHAEALVVIPSSLSRLHRARLNERAVRSRLPTMWEWHDAAVDGGLRAYGRDGASLWRRAATYVAKLRKGAKPGNLPVERPMKYELVLNLKTAKELGLTIPPTLLFQADEVIQ
jgi:putative tryptophan/tyrosine transport system substrate-binding protein